MVIQFIQSLRYFKDITEYYILGETIFEKSESEEEENEEEKFQLFYFFFTWFKNVGANMPYRKGYLFFHLIT